MGFFPRVFENPTQNGEKNIQVKDVYPPVNSGKPTYPQKNGIFEDDFPNFPRWDMLVP